LATEIITPQFLRDLTTRQLMAWKALYDHFAPCLYGVILQNVPAEISASVLEDTFMVMYNHIHEYQADKERFFTWIYKLTLRRCSLAKKGDANLSSLQSISAPSQMANG
jgi:DNA-directed RNA polymerase specialized sigma24 family protein